MKRVILTNVSLVQSESVMIMDRKVPGTFNDTHTDKKPSTLYFGETMYSAKQEIDWAKRKVKI